MKRSRLHADPAVIHEWQRRRTPLRPVSPRKRAWLREYAEARTTVLARAQGMCEGRLTGCTGRASHVHHRKGRVGADVNQPENLVALCANCHGRAHAFPRDALRLGVSTRRLVKDEGAA